MKHQPLSTSETALLDALASYRIESMSLADRQEASISMTHISIECVSWQLQMQIMIHLRWVKLIASLTKLIASFAFLIAFHQRRIPVDCLKLLVPLIADGEHRTGFHANGLSTQSLTNGLFTVSL